MYSHHSFPNKFKLEHGKLQVHKTYQKFQNKYKNANTSQRQKILLKREKKARRSHERLTLLLMTACLNIRISKNVRLNIFTLSRKFCKYLV